MASKSKKAELPPAQVYTLSTGFKFTVKQISTMLLYDVQQQIPLPEPPKTKFTHGGQTYVTDNTDDASYVERFEEAMRKRNMAALEIMIRRGVMLLPGQVPADDDWLMDLEVDLGPTLDRYRDDSGRIIKRYREYLFLRYMAIQGRADFDIISAAATLREEDVADATEAFPGDEDGGADS